MSSAALASWMLGSLLVVGLSAPAASVPVVDSDMNVLLDLNAAWNNPLTWISGINCGEFHGVTCDDTGHVTVLYLGSNLLTGSIPESIGNLSSLQGLYFSNNNLTGSIPQSIGNLSFLQSLDLSYNNLTGSIPKNLLALQNLYLYNNYLTGSIPESIGNLSSLQCLFLSSNYLTGSIPESMGNLLSLQYLYLYGNHLTGSIPKNIGSLLALQNLFLSFNYLTGSIPESIGNLSSLQRLYLHNNHFTGSIPKKIGNLLALQHLFLYDNYLTGSIPQSIGNLSSLQHLDLSTNSLTGSIPESIGNLPSLQVLYLGQNQLTGEVPSSFRNVVAFDVSENYFTQISAPKHGQRLQCPINARNCIGSSSTCKIDVGQRNPSDCSNFCNVSIATPKPCSSHGYCYKAESGGMASCVCDLQYQPGTSSAFTCILKGRFSYTKGLDVPNANTLYANKFNNNFRYSSCDYIHTSQYRHILTGVDWKYLKPEVPIQGRCGACWAFAGVGAIEMAIAIAYNLFQNDQYGSQVLRAPSLSKQQVLSCSINVGGCNGGWPSDVFQYAAANGGLATSQAYPFDESLATAPACIPQKIQNPQYPVRMWEQVGLYGPLGLMLAVQRQPVVVYIAADALSFVQYTGGVYNDPNCFSNSVVNHNVLVVGYDLGGHPAWTLKNSWGPGWGEGGYMRLSMDETGGAHGICGIYTNPAVYPVLTGPDPCKSTSNPCGGGRCIAGRVGTYTCTCVGPEFVKYINVDGTQSCAPVHQCKLRATSPCGVGACVDDGQGSYSCICPLGFVLAKRPTGDPTCQSAQLVPGPKTYTSTGLETCRLIMVTYNLTVAEFRKLNPSADCSKLLPKGRVLNLGSKVSSCNTFFTPSPKATCTSVAAYFSISKSSFQDMNQGVDCTKLLDGYQVCVKVGSFIDRLCTLPYAVLKDDNCGHIIETFKISVMDFYTLNPGINCDSLAANQYSSGQICLGLAPLGVPVCLRGRLYKTLMGDSCASIIKDKFKRDARKFMDYNSDKYRACAFQYFRSGMYFCVP